MSSLHSLSFLLLACFAFSSVVSQIPLDLTFNWTVNDGSVFFEYYGTEYNANYRILYDYYTNGFALCFYNTTPNAYTLGMRLGRDPENSNNDVMRLVWDANRGNPVEAGGTLRFGVDGNLVLSDANRRVVWQTGTANKGVVRMVLLPTGNLVLVNRRGEYLWQSFHYPTDTLMVGQGLRRGGTDRIISRVSRADGSKGPYSFVLEKQRLALYHKVDGSAKSHLYYATGHFVGKNPISRVVFNSAPGGLFYDYYFSGDNATAPVSRRIVSVNQNTTISLLRVEPDGNIRIYTYNEQVTVNPWTVTYTLFR